MGRIVAPFGIQGWIKLRTFTESRDGLAHHRRWWIRTQAGWREAEMEEFAARSAATVAKLKGCDDREGAERLRGCDVAVTRKELGEAGKGAIFWIDLIGLEVVNVKGEKLGRVEGLLQAGGSDVLVLEGERQRMIPFVADYVKSVDRKAHRITVDWEADYDL